MIAKYRLEGYDNKWFLTDFTMEQVERRIEYLETYNSNLYNACKEVVKTLQILEKGALNVEELEYANLLKKLYVKLQNGMLGDLNHVI